MSLEEDGRLIEHCRREAIRFYESKLSQEQIEECRERASEERPYNVLLFEKYRASLGGNRKNE